MLATPVLRGGPACLNRLPHGFSRSFVVVLALLAIALGTVLVASAAYMFTANHLLLDGGIRVQGTVVGIRSEERSMTPSAGYPAPQGAHRTLGGSYAYLVYIPLVRYLTTDGGVFEFEGEAATRDTNRKGDQVSVVYLPERPSEARLVEDAEGGVEYMLALLGVRPLGIGLVVLARSAVAAVRERRARTGPGARDIEATVVVVERVAGREDKPLSHVVARWTDPRSGQLHEFEDYVRMPLAAARAKFLRRRVRVRFDSRTPQDYWMTLPDGGRSARDGAAARTGRRSRR